MYERSGKALKGSQNLSGDMSENCQVYIPSLGYWQAILTKSRLIGRESLPILRVSTRFQSSPCVFKFGISAT